MTDQLNGLRFDIYERVHLPEEVAAIEELEEIELVPHMQALPQDEQVLLRGHLLLSGIYRAQDEAGSGLSQLEHWIPVEIALPLNRVQSMDELAVEIDNFDVDLIDKRSLNVTGVLALRGLQIQSAQSPVWRDDSFTVVHQAQADEAAEAPDAPESQVYLSSNDRGEPWEAEKSASEQEGFAWPGELSEREREDEWGLQQQQQPDSAFAYGDDKDSKDEKESSWLSMFQPLEESRSDEAIDKAAEEGPEAADSSELWGDLSKERVLAAEDSPSERPLSPSPAAQPEFPEAEKAPEEKQDLRVALGGKPLEEVSVPQQGVGLLSQLGEKGAKREAELRVQEAAQAQEKAQQDVAQPSGSVSGGDEVEWTRLFLSGGSESQSFRKVKMCIVQKEETLDQIAGRYSLQPRELQLYNRLQEPYLSEGQVLYIP